MGKNKQNKGDTSARITRSKFELLDGLEDEFPKLGSGKTPAANKAPAGSVTAATKALPSANENDNQAPAIHSAPGVEMGLITRGIAVTPIELPGQKSGKPGAGQTNDKTVEASTKQWKSLFKDNRDPTHGIKLRYVLPKSETLDFVDRVLPSMIEMWGFCLVGHFTGDFPGLKAVHDLKATWGVKCRVTSHEKGWVIIKFQNEEDRAKVLHEGPYMVFGRLLMLKELSEDFSFEDAEFLKVPIWVKFPKLPMKLWNDVAMSEVASMVGVPITTDKVTQERTNNDYARILIEVDVSKPPTLSFPIRLPSRKVFKQYVLYETFPNFCFHCKEYGHHPFICKKLAKSGDGESGEKEIVAVDSQEPKRKGGNIEKEKIVEEGGKIGAVSLRPESAQVPNPTGHATNPTGSSRRGAGLMVKTVDQVPNPTGPTTYPTGSKGQSAGMGAAQGHTATGKNSGALLEDTERVVKNENELHQNDVVIKCDVINGKTFKLVVKPFRFVNASVLRVDTSLRLTDDLDKKGLTFTSNCLEGLPGVTRKKGEVCFDSKFTTPFRFFMGI